MNKHYNFPLILTLTRLFVSPIVMPSLIFFLLPASILSINIFVMAVFMVLSLTDLLDGFYARRYNQVTPLGVFLDPIADKSLLCSTLISLVAINKVFFYWTIIFIGREFFIMSLRTAAVQKGFSVPVSWYGKLKTCAQVLYIAFVIFNPWHGIAGHNLFLTLEYSMLWLALASSIGSAWHYYCTFMNKLRIHHEGNV